MRVSLTLFFMLEYIRAANLCTTHDVGHAMDEQTLHEAWEHAQAAAAERTGRREEQAQLAAAREWAGRHAFGPADPSLTVPSTPAPPAPEQRLPSSQGRRPERILSEVQAQERQAAPNIGWWLTRPVWLIGWCIVLGLIWQLGAVGAAILVPVLTGGTRYTTDAAQIVAGFGATGLFVWWRRDLLISRFRSPSMGGHNLKQAIGALIGIALFLIIVVGWVEHYANDPCARSVGGVGRYLLAMCLGIGACGC
jgi:hypothetical protein